MVSSANGILVSFEKHKLEVTGEVILIRSFQPVVGHEEIQAILVWSLGMLVLVDSNADNRHVKN